MQTITMRETGEVFNIRDMVYPHIEMGVVYIRMVVVDDDDNPTHFIIATPQDIVYRLTPYNQEDMDDIIAMSKEANQKHVEMMEAAVAEKENAVVEVEEDTEHHAFYG